MAATFERVLSRDGVRAKAYARGLAPALGEGPGGREYYVSLDANIELRRNAPQIADERHLAANARGEATAVLDREPIEPNRAAVAHVLGLRHVPIPDDALVLPWAVGSPELHFHSRAVERERGLPALVP